MLKESKPQIQALPDDIYDLVKMTPKKARTTLVRASFNNGHIGQIDFQIGGLGVQVEVHQTWLVAVRSAQWDIEAPPIDDGHFTPGMAEY